jgi:uncharacterized protein with PhoU and TrkA domain
MNDRLELWVLRAGAQDLDPSPLRGLLHLGQASEDIGDAAQQMVWLIEQDEELHPILAIALGESDEVVVKLPVAPGSRADGAALSELRLSIEPGFSVLAVERGGRYFYRPRGSVQLHAGDQIIASGPDEGRAHLGQLLGWQVTEDDETGQLELEALTDRVELREWDVSRL